MKLITFAVPSYNSESYMKHCIDTLLSGGEEVEIVIVDDGSKDGTGKIADEYQTNYPSIVQAVHQENSGHGEGVNQGLRHAHGLYYKVVDSDDWLNEEALKQVLNVIRLQVEQKENADLYICNFVYEHVQDGTSYVSHYRNKMPINQTFSWESVRGFKAWHMLLMHSLIYRTEALKQSGIELPKHTFYVDNIFSYQPLPYMKKLYYIDVDLYRYFIGRSDQSVNISNMVKRYEQQLRVMKIMLDAYTYDEINAMEKGLRKYMFHALDAIMMNTIFFTTALDSKERRAGLNDLWSHLKEKDIKLYKKLRHHGHPALVNWMPWKMCGAVSTGGYKFLCKFVKLG